MESENPNLESIIKIIGFVIISIVLMIVLNSDMEQQVIIFIIVFVFGIIFIPGLRLLVFGLAGIASFFAMIASIIHFQIFGALVFFILGIILFMIAGIGN